MTALNLREGEVIKVRGWPGTRGKKFVVQSVSGEAVHAQQVEGEHEKGLVLGRFHSFHVDVCERV